MGFMILDPNNDRGHQIDVIPEKGQEYQAVRIFGKDRAIIRRWKGFMAFVIARTDYP